MKHKNYLDHVYAVSDDTGDLLELYRYTAFGSVETYTPTGQQIATSAIDNPVRWNSRRYDESTNLHYYKYRHYAPKLGRWLGRDPIGEDGGINLYAFVRNDALNKIDSLGLFFDGAMWPGVLKAKGMVEGICHCPFDGIRQALCEARGMLDQRVEARATILYPTIFTYQVFPALGFGAWVADLDVNLAASEAAGDAAEVIARIKCYPCLFRLTEVPITSVEESILLGVPLF